MSTGETQETADWSDKIDRRVEEVVDSGEHKEIIEGGSEELTLKRWETVLEAVHHDSLDLPKVTLQVATPLPDMAKEVDIHDEGSDGNEVAGEGEFRDQEEEFGPLSEAELEEDHQNTEVTLEEKRDLYEAVKSGDIDWLEDCLDKPNSDINMTWYKENMLMTAIRNGQQEMAEFLLDNGVDHTYTASVVNINDTPKGKIFERYDITCRQLAYDNDMLGIVEIIDALEGKLYPFIQLEPRIPRFRRQKPTTPSEYQGSGRDSDDADVSSGAEDGETEVDICGEAKRRKHKRKTKKQYAKAEDESERHESERHEIDTDMVADNNETAQPDQTLNDNQKSINTSKLKTSSVGILNQPVLNTTTRVLGQSEMLKDQPTIATKEPRAVTFNDQTLQVKKQCLVKPRIGSPSTKSAMGVVKARYNYRRVSAVDRVPGVQEHPMKWRKISTVGSYSRESKNWHVKHTLHQEYAEIIDLRPPSALSTTSSFSSVLSTSLPKYIHRSSFTSTISDKTSNQVEDFLPPKLKPQKPIPSYMKSTASSLTKKRLNPSFVNSYAALDFR